MSDNILPVLASLQTITVCLERVLEKAHFDTVGFVHLNTTTDIADRVHQQLFVDTGYAAIRFDMTDNSTLQHPLLMDNLFTKIFFVFFLDNFIDWLHVYRFFVQTKFLHRDNQIYVVNKYPTTNYIRRIGDVIARQYFFNAATLFWNTSGYGTGLEAYGFNVFQKVIFKIPTVHDESCSRDIHDQLFPPDKLLNFYGDNVTIYGQTEPPRIARTVAMVHGKYKHGIGGHDVLIMDTILKHLNATSSFKLMNVIAYMMSPRKYVASYKPEANTEQRLFNVSEILPCSWNIPDSTEKLKSIYTNPAIEINSQQMGFTSYMETLRTKDYAYLYPHDTDNYLIVVPKKFKSKTEYDQILKSPLVFVWTPIIVVTTVARFIFNKIRKGDKSSAVDVFFQTLGLSLGISFNTTISTAAENLLLWWFCLGTMLSGMLLSSSMFQGFALQLNILTIKNLKELELSGLEVQAPLYSESVSHFFEDNPIKLNLKYRLNYDISETIFNRNVSNAYVIREGKFNILFGNDHDIWHVIERFGFEHLSYRLRLFSAIQDRMNTILQRCVDHGIISYLVAKNRRLLSGIKPNVENIISTAFKPLTISDMQNTHLLFALGIVLSTITFIAETIYYKRNMEISTSKRIHTQKLPRK